VYAGLLLLADWRGLPDTLFTAVLMAGLAFGISFTYGITVLCGSRYPHDVPDEPRDLPGLIRFGRP
jgi:hypothetical protein